MTVRICYDFKGFIHRDFRHSLYATQKSVFTWLGIAMVTVLLLWLLGPVLTPFVVAGVLAYALNPVVNRLDALFRGKMPRVLGVLLVELLFVMSALALLLLIVPILTKQMPSLREQIPVLFDNISAWVTPLLAQLGVKFTFDFAHIKDFILKYLNTNAEDSIGSLLSSVKLGGSVALAVIGNAVLIPVVLFYLLNDWDHFVSRAQSFVPPRMRAAFDSFVKEADAVLGQYLRGQLLVMLMLAVFYSVGLVLFGLDLAWPIGIFTGLAVFVPYLGFGLGMVLALLSGLLQFASIKALVMVAVVYGAGQLVESFFLTPRFVGERIGLHPIAVIFALMAFGQLFGFVGILVALPASAVLLVAIRRLQANYMSSKLYQG
ncbi:MAG: AI-2E family transporter [Rhodoferax sp.]|nr:AI-2E family transporter [Rhodoferax sp.]